jgi:hypothetical protein
MSSIFADQKRPRIRVPMRGDGESCGVSANEYSCARAHQVTWSSNKLWRSTSIFNLCIQQSVYVYIYEKFYKKYRPLQVLTNEKRGGLTVIFFDRSRFHGCSRWNFQTSSSCERPKPAQQTLFLSFEINNCFPIAVKGELSNATTSNPPFFSMVNTF